jgi:Uncharacterised nucleotidyltransferase
MATSALQPEQQLSSSSQSFEYQLILACARCQPDIRALNQILDRASASIDWEEVIQASSMHSVLPLVYRSLSEFVPQRIPKTVLSQLMKLYLMNCAHSQRLTLATQDLVKIFADHRIPLIVFKGPVLAEAIYGSINFRRFSDVDLLVREPDVPQVRQLLIDAGFQPRLLTADLEQSDYLRSRVWDDSFTHKETQVTIDLHWQLMPDYFPVAFDLDKIWTSRQPLVLQQVKLYGLSPEDLLLYLCAHGSKELWRRLIWICDVAEFMQVYPHLPWLDLLERSRTLGIERIFLLGLTLAHDLLDMPIPKSLAASVEQPIVQELAQDFKRRIFCSIETTVETAEHGFWLFHNPLHLKLRERWRDRLPQYWLTLKFVVTPNQEDWEFLKLPQALSALYYLVRPLRIALKWGFSGKTTYSS